MAKCFLDTNLFVYSMDTANPEKMKKSREILTATLAEKNAVISTQVLQEFYVAATKKLGADPFKVKNIMKSLAPLEVIAVDRNLIFEAIDIQMSYQISFWDALIISAAVQAKCDCILTEDLNNGQIIRGTEIINPYHVD